ncbi:MAG: hypothetical protein ABI906_09745 [Pseudomonadota bacterium]
MADPSRISVADQVARLERGQITSAKFDYRFLRFHAGRSGLDALKTLSRAGAGRGGPVAMAAAGRALALKNEYEAALTPMDIGIYPKGAVLPAGFQAQLAKERNVTCANAPCEAYLLDLNGDDQPEIILKSDFYATVYARNMPDETWSEVGSFQSLSCQAVMEDLRGGRAATIAPTRPWRDLIAGGQRFTFQPIGRFTPCPKVAPQPAATTAR